MEPKWENDYYEFMGLKRDCLDEEIVKAYKQLAVKYHPDKSKIPEAHHFFVKLQEAFAALKDTRTQYNEFLNKDENLQHDIFGSENFANEANEPKKRHLQDLISTIERVQKSKQETKRHKNRILKVSWKNLSSYNFDALKSIFQMFGKIEQLKVRTSKPRATISFEDPDSALLALHQKLGDPNDLLTISWKTKK